MGGWANEPFSDCQGEDCGPRGGRFYAAANTRDSGSSVDRPFPSEPASALRIEAERSRQTEYSY